MEPPSNPNSIAYSLFLDLPTEIIIGILSLLDGGSLARCRLLSTKFNDIINQTSLLQYIIELQRAGYQDVPLSPIHILDRLESIRATQRAWENPRCLVNKKTFSLPICDHDFPDIISNDGVIILMTHIPTLHSPDTAISKHTRVDLIYVSDILDDNWTKSDPLLIESDCLDVYMSLNQKLMIVVESGVPDKPTAVHFKILPEQKPHPKAQHPTLYLPVHTKTEPRDIFALSVLGDYAFFGTSHLGPSLPETRLYHWPTGAHIKTWQCNDTLILPSGHVVNTLFDLDEAGSNYLPRFEVWTFPTSAQSPSEPTLLATFLLPPLQRHNPPDMPLTLNYLFDRYDAEGHCFKPSRYTMISISIKDHELFIPLSVFLSQQVITSTEHKVHPWKDWGPRHTRLFHSFNYIAGCGYRALLSDEILDFTPLPASEVVHTVPPIDLTKDANPSVPLPHPTRSYHECTNYTGTCNDWFKDGPPSLPYKCTPIDLPSIYVPRPEPFLFQTAEGPKLLIFHLEPPEGVLTVVSF